MHTAALLHDPHSPKIAPITHNDYYRCCLAQVVRLRGGVPRTLLEPGTDDETIRLQAADYFLVAGAEGLEPSTYGFGDRRSTN